MIQSSELILNPDGSVYHLNLKPEHIAHDIIFVGDQNRVEKITQFFEKIEFSAQKREFKTQTGSYKGKRITVISTGITCPRCCSVAALYALQKSMMFTPC